VARVERQTFISTTQERDTLPRPKNNARSQLGNWMNPEDMDQELNMRFPNCMKGG
jgi:GTP-dependent phosphoenolpyruvate carboxykinase